MSKKRLDSILRQIRLRLKIGSMFETPWEYDFIRRNPPPASVNIPLKSTVKKVDIPYYRYWKKIPDRDPRYWDEQVYPAYATAEPEALTLAKRQYHFVQQGFSEDDAYRKAMVEINATENEAYVSLKNIIELIEKEGNEKLSFIIDPAIREHILENQEKLAEYPYELASLAEQGDIDRFVHIYVLYWNEIERERRMKDPTFYEAFQKLLRLLFPPNDVGKEKIWKHVKPELKKNLYEMFLLNGKRLYQPNKFFIEDYLYYYHLLKVLPNCAVDWTIEDRDGFHNWCGATLVYKAIYDTNDEEFILKYSLKMQSILFPMLLFPERCEQLPNLTVDEIRKICYENDIGYKKVEVLEPREEFSNRTEDELSPTEYESEASYKKVVLTQPREELSNSFSDHNVVQPSEDGTKHQINDENDMYDRQAEAIGSVGNEEEAKEIIKLYVRRFYKLPKLLFPRDFFCVNIALDEELLENLLANPELLKQRIASEGLDASLYPSIREQLETFANAEFVETNNNTLDIPSDENILQDIIVSVQNEAKLGDQSSVLDEESIPVNAAAVNTENETDPKFTLLDVEELRKLSDAEQAEYLEKLQPTLEKLEALDKTDYGLNNSLKSYFDPETNDALDEIIKDLSIKDLMETDEEVINDVRGYKPAAASEVSHNEAAPVSEVSHSEAAPVSEVSHNEATAASGVSHNNAAPASEGPHSEAVDHPKDFRGASADLDDELLDLVDEIKKFDDRKFVKDLEEEEPVDEELETILKEVFSPKLDEQISNAEQHVDKVYESALELDKNIQEMEEHYRQEKEKWQNLRTVIHNLSNDRTFPQELKQNLQSTGTLVEKVQDYIENRELIKIPEKLEATLQLIHLLKQLSKHNAIPQQAKQTLETLSNDLLIESRRYSTFALLYLHNNVNVSHKRLWSYATDDLFKILKEIAEYPLLSAEAKISINTSIEKLSTFSNYAREEEKRDVYNGLIQIIGKFSRDKLLPKELRADINASVELSKRIVSVVETWNNFVKEKGENIFHKETSSPVKASLKDLLNYKGLPEKCADYINDALSELKVKSSIASTLKDLLKDAEAKKDSNTQQLLVSFDNENEREELRKMYGGPDVDLNEFLSDADLKADDDDDDSEVRIPDDEISQQAKQAYTEFVSEFREALNRNEAEDPDILLDESKTEHVFKESPEVKPEKPANWDQLLRKYFHVGENELEKERLTLWQNHHDINFDELDKEEELKQLERDRIQWLTLVRNNLRDTFLLKESARLKAEWSQRGYPGVVGSEERELNDSLREFEEKLKFEESRLRREEREKAGQRNQFKLEYENEEDDNAVDDGKVGDIERR